MSNYNQLTYLALNAAKAAGSAILSVYNSNTFEIEIKSDESPLTLADKQAHHIICAALQETGIPVLSEEGNNHEYEKRKAWSRVWIVDPLDGTKEFISRNGEFTVNIALIEHGKPIIGVLLAPVSGRCYFGIVNQAAFLVSNVYSTELSSYESYIAIAQKLPLVRRSEEMVIVASRSHKSIETEEFISDLSKKSKIDVVNIGSALKMGLIAEGAADIYPRFAPTMEWDVAAGHAIIKASGGSVCNAQTNQELSYNKPSLLNDWFVAKSKSQQTNLE